MPKSSIFIHNLLYHMARWYLYRGKSYVHSRQAILPDISSLTVTQESTAKRVNN